MPSATPRTSPAPRRERRPRRSPAQIGAPDPRPVTAYTVAVSTVAGRTRLTITLGQPCVVRKPRWPVINAATGGKLFPLSATVVSTVQFYFDFAGLLPSVYGFIEAPYQDKEVQNFQGGFVRPGGQWFRTPVGG